MTEQPCNDGCNFVPGAAQDGRQSLLADIMAIRLELHLLRSGVCHAAMGMPAEWSEPYASMAPSELEDLLNRIDDHLARCWIALHAVQEVA